VKSRWRGSPDGIALASPGVMLQQAHELTSGLCPVTGWPLIGNFHLLRAKFHAFQFSRLLVFAQPINRE